MSRTRHTNPIKSVAAISIAKLTGVNRWKSPQNPLAKATAMVTRVNWLVGPSTSPASNKTVESKARDLNSDPRHNKQQNDVLKGEDPVVIVERLLGKMRP